MNTTAIVEAIQLFFMKIVLTCRWDNEEDGKPIMDQTIYKILKNIFKDHIHQDIFAIKGAEIEVDLTADDDEI